MASTSRGLSSSRQGSPETLSRRLSWSRSPQEIDTTMYQNSNLTFENEEPPGIFRQDLHSDLDSPVYDDRTHLTSSNTVWRRSAPYERDLERRRGDGMNSSRPRATLRAMSKSIRRASIRVVNFAGVGLDDRPVRLDDVDDIPNEESTVPPEPSSNSPLRGRTLGLFGSNNPIRIFMHRILASTGTEAVVLLLIISNAIILTIQSMRSIFLQTPNGPGYFISWEDTVLLGLFIVYSLEALARILVSGLIIDPELSFASLRMPLSGLRQEGPLATRLESIKPRFLRSADGSLRAADSARRAHIWSEKSSTASSNRPQAQPIQGYNGSGSGFSLQSKDLPFREALDKQKDITETSRPYLRHSWNRVDAVAIISFWIMFALSITGLEKTASLHIYIFRALSVLRTARLLSVTSGTTTIMRSLKKAAPQLVNVAFFVFFAIVLFSIVGMQSFKGSFRRNCVLVENGVQTIVLSQTCGGYINPVTLKEVGFIDSNNVQTTSSKGFTCPLGQICLESPNNPHQDSQHFDNILGAALQIVIVASANQWSSTMYAMMDADFFVSCVFFIVCLIVLNFWLMNLFVAAITQSFSASRAETKQSAFGAEAPLVLLDDKEEDGWTVVNGKRVRTVGKLQEWYRYGGPFFAFLALASLSLQAIRTTTTPQSTIDITVWCERGITAAFGIEIIWRLLATLPTWRSFFTKLNNNVDLFLAVICGIILIPPIPSTSVYPWLTVFQLARFYRVILLVPGMRKLLFQVFGNLRGLFNMSIFLLLANYLAALFAVQLFRGDISESTMMNFRHIWNAFLGMYQVFTSENWTDVMWSASDAEFSFKMQVITILFIVIWFFFANFIMLQMFIAVINENFDVAEEQKRAQQVHAYIRRAEPAAATINWIERLNPYRRLRANPRAVDVGTIPGNLVLPMRQALVRDYRAPGEPTALRSNTRGLEDSAIVQGPLGTMRRMLGMDSSAEHVPLTTLGRGTGPRTDPQLQRNTLEMDDADRHLEVFAPGNHDTTAEDNADVEYEQRARKADFINDHPTYDKTLWVFSQRNPIRQFCQRLVPPSNGDHEERIFGLPPSPWLEFSFRALMLVTVIAGISVGAVASPVYRRDFFKTHPISGGTWFDIAEATFGFLLVVEFLIKVVADGFIFTPNAYFLNIWNILDFVILIAILINVIATLIVVGGAARITRALKAFRALRLITLIGWMRETFHSVIFAGARRIIDAAVLAILYMIPYAVWGLNVFSGRLFSCNDNGSNGKDDCRNEYQASPVGNVTFLAPRVWDNPTPSTSFSFDSFGAAFLILFEIVSLEGWIDVLQAALGITGRDQQPRNNASQWNAIFFVLYNLLGAVVILTLFVSIIISNFSSRSGMALLTTEQRQWIDLQKLISRQKQSKRPHIRPTGKLQAWCYDRAVKKRGWWSKAMTVLYCVQIAVLMSQTFKDNALTDRIRDLIFLCLSLCFMADPLIKFVGLGWTSFRANGWNIFDVIVVLGSFATTLATLLGQGGFAPRQAQKLFLVCVAFKLMQKLDSLNQLFKTSVSSLGVITKLFGLWFALFLFFGMLWLEVFALTKWGSGETHNANYQSLGRALVMLAFMSTGEGWNQYMHDYAIEYPRCTNSNILETTSDCGSSGWSFSLYIMWNILSMYIFVNMFTGVVVENFSYIYQQRRNSTLNREEMRSFKKVWAIFDPRSTGFLEHKKIVPFLARLSGVFEVRIYPAEFHIQNLLANSQVMPGESFALPRDVVANVDLQKLAANIERINFADIRARRKVYNRLFWEAHLLDANGKGISFQNMLLLLAHYKLIDDEKALKVEEHVRRRAVTEQVEDRVNFDKVRSLFRMIYHRRRFVAHLEEQQRAQRARTLSDLPEIVVAEPPFSPNLHSRDITHAHHDSLGGLDLESPVPTRTSFNTRFAVGSPEGNWSDPASPSRRDAFRNSDTSMFSGSSPKLYPSSPKQRESFVEDPQAILATLNTSVWSDLMVEAAAEEEEEEERQHPR